MQFNCQQTPRRACFQVKMFFLSEALGCHQCLTLKLVIEEETIIIVSLVHIVFLMSPEQTLILQMTGMHAGNDILLFDLISY